mgnify:CR=1 FL=1
MNFKNIDSSFEPETGRLSLQYQEDTAEIENIDECKVLAANKSFLNLFNLEEFVAAGQKITDFQNYEWVRDVLKSHLKTRQSIFTSPQGKRVIVSTVKGESNQFEVFFKRLNLPDETLFFQNLNQPYQLIDYQGVIIDLNDEWLREFGYTREEVINHSFASLFGDSVQLSAIFNGDQPVGTIHNFNIKTKTGTELSVELNIASVFKEDHKLWYHCLFKTTTNTQPTFQLQNDLIQLSGLLPSFLKKKTEDEIYEYMGSVLAKRFPQLIMVLAKNTDKNKLEFYDYWGSRKHLIKQAFSKFGYHLSENEFPVKPDVLELLHQGKLLLYPGSFVEYFSGHSIPLGITKILASVLSISKIYLLGIIKESRLKAGLHIYSDVDISLADQIYIDSVVQMATLMLQFSEEKSNLSLNHQFFANLLDKLPIGLQVFDQEGVSRLINKKQAELLELKDSRLDIGNYNVLIDLKSRSSGAAATFQKVYQQKKLFSREFQQNFGQKDSNQSKKWFKEIIFPVVNNEEELISVVSLLQDITEKKVAEQKLIDSEKRWRFALEGTGDGLWDWNLNTNEFYFSEQWSRMLGYEPGEVPHLYQEWEKKVHPDDLAVVLKNLMEHVSGDREIYLSEYRIRCKDGSYRWIMDRGKVLEYTVNGLPSRMIGIQSDIEERKKIENALRESETKYRVVVTALHDGIILQDKDSKLITCNNAANDLLGLSIDQLSGNKPVYSGWQIIDEAGNSLSLNDLPHSISLKTGESVQDFVVGILKTEQKITWISINSEPIFLKGSADPDLVVSSLFDISKIKATEKRLQDSQTEILKLNATKDRFLNIIGHDLKSPFMQLSELSKLIKVSIDKKNYEEVTIISDMIDKSAQTGYNLLINILDWSRSQTGKILVRPEVLKLSDLVLSTFRLLEPTAYQKKINLVNRIAPTTEVFADENMVLTILRNLVSNAIKFSYPESDIYVSSFIDSDQFIAIVVEDQGMGIKESNQKRLFDQTQIFTSQGTNKEKGSGLGLLICKDFVEKNAGRIYLDSTEQKGTKFTFTLPQPDQYT